MRRSLAEWLDWQQRVHPRTMDFTLDRVRVVLDRLGLLQPRAHVITVGGTNGKGSVTALLDAVLRAGGARVGHYTSPHLVRYEERIRIDGREIEAAQLCDLFERVEAARGDVTLTFFEYATVTALLAFADAQLDVLVLEVGLGGRLDAVNAIDPDVAVVVSIGLDHVEHLGPTPEHIGREKAGIFRAGRPAIYGSREMPCSIAECAGALGARLERFGQEFEAIVPDAGGAWTWRRGAQALEGLPAPALPGRVQYDNAATALAALAAGGRLPPRAALERGLREVTLAGRFQVLRAGNGVEWILDVAHNEDSAKVLAANLAARPCAGRTWFVAGMLRDKDAAAVGRALTGGALAASAWCLVTLGGERGLEATELARRFGLAAAVPSAGSAPVATVTDVESGCRWAADRAHPGDRVVVFGSFHTVGPALEWIRVHSPPLR